jgi:hypothetical protein
MAMQPMAMQPMAMQPMATQPMATQPTTTPPTTTPPTTTMVTPPAATAPTDVATAVVAPSDTDSDQPVDPTVGLATQNHAPLETSPKAPDEPIPPPTPVDAATPAPAFDAIGTEADPLGGATPAQPVVKPQPIVESDAGLPTSPPASILAPAKKPVAAPARPAGKAAKGKPASTAASGHFPPPPPDDAPVAAPQLIAAADPAAIEPAPTGVLKLAVSLVWEGRDLQPYNLAAIRSFRERFASIRLVHFVSPAYFARAGADATAVRSALRSVMRPGDKLGIAIGGWKSLAAKAGVIFRDNPTFWGQTLRPSDCARDCGLDVPVNVYPQAEVSRLTRAGIDVLEANGFGRVEAGLATGWVASPQVLEAFAENGIRYDFSAVAPELVAKRLGSFPLYRWVKGIWGNVTPHTQPYVVPAVSAPITEIPQGLAAIDYLTERDVTAIFAEYVGRLRREPSRDLTFQLAFYQETARQSLPMLEKALQSVFALSGKANVSLRPLDAPGMNLPPPAPGDALSH